MFDVLIIIHVQTFNQIVKDVGLGTLKQEGDKIYKYNVSRNCPFFLVFSENFHWHDWGSLLPCLRTRDTLPGPPLTPAEIFCHTCPVKICQAK